MTQFQIEGGGVVPGVTRLILNFQLFLPKTKIMPIKFTKNGFDSSFSGSDKFFKKGRKKSNMLEKSLFSQFLQQQKIN